MRIGMHTITLHCIAYADHLDNTTSRNGLNAHQAAFANKQYKSYQRVGLPSDITKPPTAQGG